VSVTHICTVGRSETAAVKVLTKFFIMALYTIVEILLDLWLIWLYTSKRYGSLTVDHRKYFDLNCWLTVNLTTAADLRTEYMCMTLPCLNACIWELLLHCIMVDFSHNLDSFKSLALNLSNKYILYILYELALLV